MSPWINSFFNGVLPKPFNSLLGTVLLFFVAWSWLQAGFAQTQSLKESQTVSRPQVAQAIKTHTQVNKSSQHAQHALPKPVPATPIEEPVAPELSPELMAISEQVQWGRMPCELGQSVTLNPVANAPGQFTLFFKSNRYALSPTLSHTGAIRLEDAKQGAVWIQLANKSMLFNTRLGQRMVDECKSKEQEQVAIRQRNSPPVQLLSAVNGADEQR